MSLVKCLECKKKISDQAKSCPHCGCPVSTKTEDHKPEQFSPTLKLIVWIIGYFLYLSMLPPLIGMVLSVLLILFVYYAKFSEHGKVKFSPFVSYKLLITITLLGLISLSIFSSRRDLAIKNHEKAIAQEEARKAKKAKLEELKAEFARNKDFILKEADSYASSNNFNQAIDILEKYQHASPEVLEKIKHYKVTQARLDKANKIKQILSQIKVLEKDNKYEEIIKISEKLIKNPEVKNAYDNAVQKVAEQEANNLAEEILITVNSKPEKLSIQKIDKILTSIDDVSSEHRLFMSEPASFWTNLTEILIEASERLNFTSPYTDKVEQQALKFIYRADKLNKRAEPDQARNKRIDKHKEHLEKRRKNRLDLKYEKQKEEKRLKKFQENISGWSGEHRSLAKHIKSRLKSPSSYKHVKTSYSDDGDNFTLITQIKAKNAYGVEIQEIWEAKVSLYGKVISANPVR